MRPSMLRHSRRTASAFLMMDLLMAMAIAGALILSLSFTVGTLRRGERRMADARALDRRLEDGLLTLQSGGKADPGLQVERLGNGPANRVWVRLSLRPGTPVAAPSGPEAGSAAPPAAAPQPTASLVGLISADKAGGAP